MMGLHKALGATGGKLFVEAFIQNLVLVLLAVGVDALVLSLPLEKIFSTEIQYGAACIAQVLAAGVALALVLSLFCVRAARKPVCRLIDGQKQ